MAKKQPSSIDAHVGSRVRLRRMLIGMSQEKLGELLGLTFQQVQKYEKGANRIGASRLYDISQILNVPVQYFFEELPQPSLERINGAGLSEPDREPILMDFVSSAEGLQLIRSFTRVSDGRVRKRILELVKSLGGEEDDAASQKTAAAAGTTPHAA
jgi:transcriptional regulator with XRE-family HTH domain